ncbi:MAG: sodium transporter [Acidobacteria bacterium]|nr:sodium transporter [Acidobacteriota bacterium]
MSETLASADYAVLAAYLGAIVVMSIAIAARQKTGEEFFLAGRTMRGRTLALSIMANQASAVSLIGAPAFVALQANGGMRWLQYELALPVAMLLVIALLLPALRSVKGASIYEYTEVRFGKGTRRLVATFFVVSRGLATGVILFATALVVAPVLDTSIPTAIALTGLFSVGYCVLGGIVADIWSDIIQLVVLWVGVIVSAGYIFAHAGMRVFEAVPLDRTRTIILESAGLTDGNSFALLPMIAGGVILYMSYYACDQTQGQRLLAAASEHDARTALALNGLLRFPLVLTYCGFGLLLAGLLRVDPEFAARMAGQPADSLVPAFMIGYLPAGLRGLLLAAILAAAMSSLDSALNSLAAITLDDLVGIDSIRGNVWLGRLMTLAWGISAILSAVVFSKSGTGILVLITQLGSIFYGPVLAVFLLGAMTRGVDGRAASIGMCLGLVANLAAARLATGMSSLWWNVLGFAVAAIAALALSREVRGEWSFEAPRRDALVLGWGAAAMLLIVALLPPMIALVATD